MVTQSGGGLPKVVVREPYPDGGMAPLESVAELVRLPQGASRADLLAALAPAQGFIALLTDTVDEELLSGAPQLRVVSNFAVGVNNVDLEAARRRGLWVTNTPDVLTDATADFTLALLLAVTRRLGEGERELRSGRFTGWTPTYMLGVGLAGRTLGIVGLGRIGRAVAARARTFGMRVVATRSAGAHATTDVPSLPLSELLATSDVVSLHVPFTRETRHLIDAAALARMRSDAFLLNTCRGPVVDEAALAEALHAGHLGGAALDVYEDEPRVHPRLLTAPRTVLAPHLGSATLEARLAMARLAAHNAAAVLRGELPAAWVVRPGAA